MDDEQAGSVAEHDRSPKAVKVWPRRPRSRTPMWRLRTPVPVYNPPRSA